MEDESNFINNIEEENKEDINLERNEILNKIFASENNDI